MAWSFLIVLAWKPIWWIGNVIYHKLKKDEWNSDAYMASIKQWGLNLWGLVKPGDL